MSRSLIALLHLCDSLFPIGSFAHSDGLEAATSRGEIRTAHDLRGWMDVMLREPLRHVEGPAVGRAWESATKRELDAIAALDDEVHALRPNSAGREATRAMGSRLVKTWHQIRPDEWLQIVLTTRSLTLPVAFGVVTAVSDVPQAAAVEAYLYTRLAAIVSAAMRLIPLGQHDGHALLADTLSQVDSLAHDIVADDQPLRSFTPLLDVTAMSHQYVESRLFKS